MSEVVFYPSQPITVTGSPQPPVMTPGIPPTSMTVVVIATGKKKGQ
jgi:hypothetical protein